jgi:hypothetical protein
LLGRPIPFDRVRHDRFQHILRQYGDPALVAAKCDIIGAVLTGDPPPRDPRELPGFTRQAAALALRQLAHLGPDAALLRRWAGSLDRSSRIGG